MPSKSPIKLTKAQKILAHQQSLDLPSYERYENCSPKLKVTNLYCKLVGLSKSVELRTLVWPSLSYRSPPSQAFPAPTFVKNLKLDSHWKIMLGRLLLGKWLFRGYVYMLNFGGDILLKPAKVGWFSGYPRPKKTMTRESLISLHLLAPQLNIICFRFFGDLYKQKQKNMNIFPTTCIMCSFWSRYPLLRNASKTGGSLLPNCGTRHPTSEKDVW